MLVDSGPFIRIMSANDIGWVYEWKELLILALLRETDPDDRPICLSADVEYQKD